MSRSPVRVLVFGLVLGSTLAACGLKQDVKDQLAQGTLPGGPDSDVIVPPEAGLRDGPLPLLLHTGSPDEEVLRIGFRVAARFALRRLGFRRFLRL